MLMLVLVLGLMLVLVLVLGLLRPVCCGYMDGFDPSL
jgi:hypothetical protein